jgi:IS605 OrfB family transposase
VAAPEPRRSVPGRHLRSVCLVIEAGRLYVDVTARLPVDDAGVDPSRIAGVDLGLIHPFAIAAEGEALVVSGRLLRAEERLHLADTKARARKVARKAPAKGQRGSRRWRRLRAAQRSAEARHRRRVRAAHHRAAHAVLDWAEQRGIGTLAVGDLRGITSRATGKRHNLRLRQWRRTHLLRCLRDKAELRGIAVALMDERGTSSTCPACHRTGVRPRGRTFKCGACGFEGHRDVVGAQNIAARGGGFTTADVVVTHRRAGLTPARRDRRRQLMDVRRSSLARGRPAGAGSRSRVWVRVGPNRTATLPRAGPLATCEDPIAPARPEVALARLPIP